MLGQPEPLDETTNGDTSCVDNSIKSDSSCLPEPYHDNRQKNGQNMCSSNTSISTSDYANTLEVFARQYGFLVHDVPGDGDCLFSSVAYQLQNVGYHVNKDNLRQILVRSW